MKHLKRILSMGVLWALLSCSEELMNGPRGNPVVPGENSSMEIKFISQNSADFTALAKRAVVHISGDGLQTVTHELTVTDTSVEGTLESVPAGDNRLFTIEVFDGNGVVQYMGMSSVDVKPGAVASLPIRIKRQYYGREGDSIALVELDKQNITPLWDWSTPIDTWSGIYIGSEPSEAIGRVLSLYPGDGFLPAYIPEEIGNLTELKILRLYGSFSSLPEEFGKLTNLSEMAVYNTKLSSLPYSLRNCDKLSRLELMNCEFTEIPPVLGELAVLSELFMKGNRIEKLTLPNLDRVDTLYLPENLIREIDGSISNLKKVIQLDLGGNRLTDLPDEIGKLSTLKFFSARHNEFREIPSALARCESLNSVELSYNSISTVSDEVIAKSDTWSLTVRNNALSFGVLEKLMGFRSFSVDPQDTLGEAATVTGSEAVKIGVVVTGTANQYRWTRDGIYYAQGDSVIARESGVYECKITNSKVRVNANIQRELELVHRPVMVTVNDDTAPVLTNTPGLSITSGESLVRIAPELFEVDEAVTEFNAITVVITALPVNGKLQRYSNMITEPGFEDLSFGAMADGNLFNYSHYGTGTSDSFKFRLVDAAGNRSEEYEFNISIRQ